MHYIRPEFHSRRAFLRRSGQLAFAGAAMPMAMNLVAMGEAAAQAAPVGEDYKALVCVFLYGGNDYANTVVTYDDPSYNLYSAVRGGGAGQTAGGIALAKADLTALAATTAGNRQYAFHPAMSGLTGLFNAGTAAVVLNTGPLVVPMTRAQYFGANRTAYPLPPKLFSHNDQQSLWQSSSPEGSTVGWGGNIGDLALSQNSKSLFTCISITGNAVFLSGDTALSYQVGSGGATKINSAVDGSYPLGFLGVSAAMKNIITGARPSNNLENEYNIVTKRAIEAEVGITAAIDSTKAVNNVYPAPFDGFPAGNSLSDQMRMVARLIAGRKNSAIGAKRQVFMVSLGGFDCHDNLVTKQAELMKKLSDAMTAFQGAMAHPSINLSNNVTAFTASDFGRTLTSNGDGSDHGWGGHQIVVGGAVNGKQFHGYAPPVAAGDKNSVLPIDAWQVGQGRLLPTTSVDQYAATLAKWFGVPDAQLGDIVPNLRNFGGGDLTVNSEVFKYPKTLGFMKVA